MAKTEKKAAEKKAAKKTEKTPKEKKVGGGRGGEQSCCCVGRLHAPLPPPPPPPAAACMLEGGGQLLTAVAGPGVRGRNCVTSMTGSHVLQQHSPSRIVPRNTQPPRGSHHRSKAHGELAGQDPRVRHRARQHDEVVEAGNAVPVEGMRDRRRVGGTTPGVSKRLHCVCPGMPETAMPPKPTNTHTHHMPNFL
jgi:hypothetical protein